jgi:hypothetical protein
MPASDYFTATNYTDYNEQPEYISFRLLGTGNISFKQNLTTYFTVIGGGGGGGGGGGDIQAEKTGGGGGAGASGKISFLTTNNVPYSYVVGTGGAEGSGYHLTNGGNGTNSSVIFTVGEKIIAEGGTGGGGAGIGGANPPQGGPGGGLTILGVSAIITGVSGNGGNGWIDGTTWPPTNPSPAEHGTDQSPTTIYTYPDISKPVGGGGGGGYFGGGGGGNGTGGSAGSSSWNGSSNDPGFPGIAYGGGGGGGGEDGANNGGSGKEGAIFVYFVPPPPPPPIPPSPIPSGNGPIQICNSRFRNCNSFNKNKPGSSGTIVTNQHTKFQKMSTSILFQNHMRNKKWTLKNAPTNVFGQRAGGPHGYGQPPKNTF